TSPRHSRRATCLSWFPVSWILCLRGGATRKSGWCQRSTVLLPKRSCRSSGRNHQRELDVSAYLFHGGRLLDPRRDTLVDNAHVLVENDRIKEVSDRPISATSAARIDLRGRTLMPGLIDAHIHILLPEVNLHFLDSVPLTLLAAKGSVSARAMLMRGFTSVRDTGGADYGMRAAIESGLIEGPRLFISGMPISQTGGHGD